MFIKLVILQTFQTTFVIHLKQIHVRIVTNVPPRHIHHH